MKKGFIDVNIDKLVEADWNYKEENPEMMGKLKNNIRRNGLVENIIVRELDDKFEVVNGNHRLIALREIGWDKPVHVYNCGKISLAEAKRISIETNETKFLADTILLAERIKEITETFTVNEIAITMPYDEEQLQDMVKMLDFDFSQFEKIENLEKGGREVLCPYCGKKFEI